jgi:hypothetical protein
MLRAVILSVAQLLVAKYKSIRTEHSCIAGPLIISLVTLFVGADLAIFHKDDFSQVLVWESAAYAIFTIPVVSM